MKKIILVILTCLLPLGLYAKPLPTASFVEIERYVGKWYSITSLPQFFTRNCLSQTAEYEILNAKTISVLNTCYKTKSKTTITGKAVVINPKTNAELIVTFDNFFTRLFRVKGDYTIIKLDENYDHVMIGSKDRKSLWIMSRSPDMPEAILYDYVEIAKKEGFPVSKLVKSI